MYASVASMIQQFNMDNIRLLLELGYEVDVACNMEYGSTITPEKVAAMKVQLERMGVQLLHIPVPRKITAIGEIAKAFRQTREIMNRRKYKLIHCHSPIGGIICRLANRASKHYGSAKMIYTAHGFHFYKGAPWTNWLIFYPVEKISSLFTNLIITINQEDFLLAQRKMRAKEVRYVPGVGIHTKTFADAKVDQPKKRSEIDVPEDAFLLFSVGELNSNKNHEAIVRTMEHLPSDIHYVVAGRGSLQPHLMNIARACGIENRVHLLGFRSDVAQLLKMADLFVFPSLREGLPVSVMEAMAAGKPVVCSKIRGNVDLIEENRGGYLVDAGDIHGYVRSIETLYLNKRKREEMGAFNAQKAMHYDAENIRQHMADIYGINE